MAKTGDKEQASKSGGNKHVIARMSYLHQAAKYLSEAQSRDRKKDLQLPSAGDENDRGNIVVSSIISGSASGLGEQRRLVAHLKGVSNKGKGQARLPLEMKHSMCKRCDTYLVEPSTCTIFKENKSVGSKKPWADVKVVRCLACGADKRFPIGSSRQLRKSKREKRMDVETQSSRVSLDKQMALPQHTMGSDAS